MRVAIYRRFERLFLQCRIRMVWSMVQGCATSRDRFAATSRHRFALPISDVLVGVSHRSIGLIGLVLAVGVVSLIRFGCARRRIPMLRSH